MYIKYEPIRKKLFKNNILILLKKNASLSKKREIKLHVLS